MRCIPFSLTVSCITLPALAAPEHDESDTVILFPSTPWHVSLKDGLCQAGRLFGSAESSHALSIEQFAPGTIVDVMLAGPEMSNFDARPQSRVRFAADLPPIKKPFYTGQVDGFGKAILIEQLEISAEELSASGTNVEGEAAPFGTGFDIKLGARLNYVSVAQGDKTVVFDTGSMGEILQVMNDCTAQILKNWDLDADVLNTASRGVKLTNPEELSRRLAHAYPVRSLREREQGKVGVLVKVDQQGRVDDCRVVSDSGSTALNQAACNGMQVASFDPALDANGAPVAAYYATRISYRLN